MIVWAVSFQLTTLSPHFNYGIRLSMSIYLLNKLIYTAVFLKYFYLRTPLHLKKLLKLHRAFVYVGSLYQSLLYLTLKQILKFLFSNSFKNNNNKCTPY